MPTPAPSGWSSAEVRLWKAVRDGVTLDLTTDGAGQTGQPNGGTEITADVLKRVMLQPPDVSPGVVPAVHLIGARVTGQLSLCHASIDLPVTIAQSQFDGPVRLDGARVRALDFSGSRIPT